MIDIVNLDYRSRFVTSLFAKNWTMAMVRDFVKIFGEPAVINQNWINFEVIRAHSSVETDQCYRWTARMIGFVFLLKAEFGQGAQVFSILSEMPYTVNSSMWRPANMIGPQGTMMRRFARSSANAHAEPLNRWNF